MFIGTPYKSILTSNIVFFLFLLFTLCRFQSFSFFHVKINSDGITNNLHFWYARTVTLFLQCCLFDDESFSFWWSKFTLFFFFALFFLTSFACHGASIRIRSTVIFISI